MMKKTIKNLSTMALAVIIGVSALGGVAQAAECGTRALNGTTCPSCNTTDIEESSRSNIDCTFADSNGHMVTDRVWYDCNACYAYFQEQETYYEAHDYQLMALENKMVCTGCYDWYYWNRVALEE